MAAKRVSYPHPVVGLGDDVEGAVLPFEVETTSDAREVKISISGLAVSNNTLNLLIGQAMAEFVVRVHCSQTFFRSAWATTRGSLDITIPIFRLAEEVRIAVRVCARVAIPEYRPDGLNPDYGDTRFAIEAGDVLAEGDQVKVFLSSDYDPLAGKVGSIMQVRRGPFEQGIRVDFNDQKISIEVGDKDFSLYSDVRAGAPALLHSGLVFPVLVEAIGQLAPADGPVDDLLWKSRLTAMLEAKGIDLANGPLMAAQALLQNPLRRTYEEAKRLLESD